MDLEDINPVMLSIHTTVALIAYGAIRGLRPRHASDIQTLAYFFSLAFVITCLAVMWGKQQGAFDEHGYPKGSAGHLLKTLLDAAGDSRTDAAIVGAIVAVLVVPQLLSYAISGLFGCASKVWFIQTGLRFVIWSVIKFFVVLSGVVASLVLVGPDSFHRMPENFGISFAFFAIALALLFLYRLTEQTLAWCFARCPRMIQKSLLRIDVWATRFRT